MNTTGHTRRFNALGGIHCVTPDVKHRSLTFKYSSDGDSRMDAYSSFKRKNQIISYFVEFIESCYCKIEGDNWSRGLAAATFAR